MVVCMVETPLGTVLEGWMRRQRLNPSQLSDLSGLTRRTVYNVLNPDRPAKTEVETVWKLATGLATDPYTHQRDELVYADAFTDLLEAAGYPRDMARVIRIDLEDEVTRRLRDTDRARLAIAFLDRYAYLPDAERDVFDRLIGMKADEDR